jgi:hypothetical protein
MSVNYDGVEAAVKSFVESQNGASFEGRELLDFVIANLPKGRKPSKKAPQGREIGEMALEILKSLEDGILCDPASGRFQTAEGFFKGALFRATPSREELAEGILLPYPRLAFFCNPELCGADEIAITPSDIPGAAPIGSKTHAMAFDALSESHILVGRSALVDYLVAESHANFAPLKAHEAPKTKMNLSVFDMRDYYGKSGFQEGDSLIFEVLDWRLGRYSFRREPIRSSEADRREWMHSLERSLARTWKDFGDYLEIADQVAAALFSDACSGGVLAKSPHVGLDEAHRLFKEIALVQEGGEWALVPSEELASEMGADELPPDAVKELSPSDFSVSKGKLTEEDVLKEIKFPYPLPILQAMIFDELSNGCESFEEFHSRNIAGLSLEFADDAQEAAFLNFIEDLWEDSQERFNPAGDEAKSPLRVRILELAKDCAGILAAIVARAATPERDAVLEAYKLHHGGVASLQKDIIETLALLNSDSPLPDEGGEYDDLELRVGDMEDLWDSLLEVLEPIAGRD